MAGALSTQRMPSLRIGTISVPMRRASIYADYKGGQRGSLPAYNWRALGVLFASFAITMIGRLPGVASIEFLAQVNNLAFFSGLIIGFAGYTLLTLTARKTR